MWIRNENVCMYVYVCMTRGKSGTIRQENFHNRSDRELAYISHLYSKSLLRLAPAPLYGLPPTSVALLRIILKAMSFSSESISCRYLGSFPNARCISESSFVQFRISRSVTHTLRDSGRDGGIIKDVH